jgi:hypothetical protein
MKENGIIVRILGIASTTRGFAFAVTEGPRRLVSWGLRRVPVATAKSVKTMNKVLLKARPLFVAFEREDSLKKRHRGKHFDAVVTRACDAHGIMILNMGSGQTHSLCMPRKSKWSLADTLAKLFPELRDKVPPRRKPWQSEDDRIGLFMALAAAVSAWESLGGPHMAHTC